MNADSLWSDQLARLRDALAILPDKPEETAANTLRALWLTAAGRPASAAAAEKAELPALQPPQRTELEHLVSRRLAHVPLAHLTGRQHFMGLELLAGPQALVPRVETELLARTAAERAIATAAEQQPLLIVDACTGSGNVALALAHHLCQAGVTARIAGADLSTDAVELARRNADFLHLADIVEFAVGDLLAPFDSEAYLGSVDVLTCNPPYINHGKVERMAAEIAAHEPHMAFDGGPFGISIVMRLIDAAPRYLKPGGWLIFEIGLGQGDGFVKRLRNNPAFAEIQAVADRAGDIRVVCARKAARP